VTTPSPILTSRGGSVVNGCGLINLVLQV